MLEKMWHMWFFFRAFKHVIENNNAKVRRGSKIVISFDYFHSIVLKITNLPPSSVAYGIEKYILTRGPFKGTLNSY